MEIVKKNLELKVVALNDTLAEQQKLIDDISKNVSMTESEISSLIKELEKIDGKIDQEKRRYYKRNYLQHKELKLKKEDVKCCKETRNSILIFQHQSSIMTEHTYNGLYHHLTE